MTETQTSPVPLYFPRSRQEHFARKPLGQGTRMLVHASLDPDVSTVLRAPKKTEEAMFEIARRTGEVFKNGNGDPRISPITKRDIKEQSGLTNYIGRNMAPVLPFVDEDMEGNVRVYSTQEKVSVACDISHSFGDPTSDFTRQSRRSFARLLAGIRELAEERQVIPDLVGHGNVVLTDEGNVVLVDINNVRPVLGEHEWSRGEMTQKLWEEIINREGGKLLKEFLAPGYVDELGQPIGDASIYQLRAWEMYLARHKDAAKAEARDLDSIREDPLYRIIDEERDMWRDRILTFMIAGEIRVPKM